MDQKTHRPFLLQVKAISKIMSQIMNSISNTSIKETITGSRNIGSFVIFLVLLFAGGGFFLAGLSSYLGINLLKITNTEEIVFIPQGITMLFYGTVAMGIGTYILLTIIWNIGSGYNEFSKNDNIVRLIRLGFPGKNRTIFLSYEFKNIKNLKFLLKQGLNPRCNILLVLKDKREIPLFPAQFLLNPSQLEKKAIQLSQFLEVPLESLII